MGFLNIYSLYSPCTVSIPAPIFIFIQLTVKVNIICTAQWVVASHIIVGLNIILDSELVCLIVPWALLPGDCWACEWCVGASSGQGVWPAYQCSLHMKIPNQSKSCLPNKMELVAVLETPALPGLVLINVSGAPKL